MRLFKTAGFVHWARADGVTDGQLLNAALEIERGLIEARLGGFLIKKRVAAPGRGKRSGFRVIIAYRQADRLIFLHGFAKNEKENISKQEFMVLSKRGEIYLCFNDEQIAVATQIGDLMEITP